jgi:hypothetical protein
MWSKVESLSLNPYSKPKNKVSKSYTNLITKPRLYANMNVRLVDIRESDKGESGLENNKKGRQPLGRLRKSQSRRYEGQNIHVPFIYKDVG